MFTINYQDLGLISYKEAWDLQEGIFGEMMKRKLGNAKLPEGEKISLQNRILFCEHPHVFTLGKSGSQANLLINEKFLQEKGIEFFHINRGGDITYHGPGQIVGYPILDLEEFGLGIREYIHLLEEAVILLLADYSISAGRLDGATGVWLDAGDKLKARKICAIGVKASRHITMHGFAFNVNTQLEYYNYINPCGFTDKGVTSMEKELGEIQNIEKVKSALLDKLMTLLRAVPAETPLASGK
jgi:lipoyl(octanoyl) transferase